MRTLSFDIILPEGTKWVAQDAIGQWWAFTLLPVYTAPHWNSKHVDFPLCQGPVPADAALQLYEVNRSK